MHDQSQGQCIALHVVTSLGFGGVEKHMEILAEAQHSSERDHLFCAIGSGGAAADNISALNCSVYCLEQSVSIPSLGSIRSLVALFRRLKPEVVHTHGAEANFHGLIAAFMCGVPVRIGEEIGIPQHSRRARMVFRQVYRLAHQVIGISDSVTKWLVDSREVSGSRATRLYNPVQLPGFEPINPGRDPSRFRLGFVGRLDAVKNPQAVIEAVSLLLERGVPAECWLVGDGQLRAALEQDVCRRGLSDVVTFLGYQKEPAAFVRQCDLYVQPSLSEGFGLAMVEAMGCGVPVLASRVGGAPEIVTHGETGWLLDAPTAECVADAAEAIWQSRDTLAATGLAGRAAVLNRFDPAGYMQELDALYDRFSKHSR